MAAGWKAGTGTITFTPGEPMWLAGWAVRQAPANGAISDLKATALALEDGDENTLVLVAADIIAIPREIADAAANRVRQTHRRLPRHHFIFAASHTHGAPEIRPDKALFFNIPPEYAAKIPLAAEQLIDAMARAALAALNNREPARLFWRRTSAGFAHNRRAGGDSNDHDVPVLEVKSASGKPAAIVFGYACHNLTLDPHDLRYCAEWSGFAREHLQEWNSGATALFMAGCGADQNPEPRGTLELARQYGLELATNTQKSLETPGREIEPIMQVAAEDLQLQMVPVTPEWIAESLLSNDPPRKVKAQFLKNKLDGDQTLDYAYSAPMQAIRLGEQVLMIAMSGEPVVEWAHRFKKEFPVPLVWVAGYCNDMYGYLPTRQVQAGGGYEGGRANLWSSLPAPWTDDVEDRIWTGIRQLVNQVSTNRK